MLIPLGILDYPAPTAAGSYDLLETEILTGTQASVTFSNLSSTYGTDYQHLQVRVVARTDRASGADNLGIYFNGDSTTTNYYAHQIYGDGSSVSSIAYANTTLTDTVIASTGTANAFGAGITDLLDAFDSSKYTTVRNFSGSTNQINLRSVLWKNTAALTSIQVFSITGSNLVSGSRVSLYGLRSA